MTSGQILVLDDKKQSIVIVDDMPDNLRLLAKILQEHNYKVRPASNGIHALSTIQKEPPDIILLDIMMPNMDGYEVCQRLKANEKLKDIPIIFLSALNEVFDKVKAFKVGGIDYITKPFQEEEVLVRINTHLTIRAQQKTLALYNKDLVRKNAMLEKQREKLEWFARIDFLTGLSNRRSFLDKSEQEKIRFKRLKKHFSFILLNIDHFKNINNKYGHECGDRVLVGVGRSIKTVLRDLDVVARWGGEEFICLLPETKFEGANHIAEKIKTTIVACVHEYGDITVSVTVTIGISQYDGTLSIPECICRADTALYKGKKLGRNQVVLAS